MEFVHAWLLAWAVEDICRQRRCLGAVYVLLAVVLWNHLKSKRRGDHDDSE